MADLFTSADAERTLRDKTILLIGDSNMRSIYKDLVWFVQNHSLIPDSALRAKLEASHANDFKLRGDRLHKGRDFIEDRSYEHGGRNFSTLIEYSFTSMCYSQNVINLFNDAKKGIISPDLIIMNSTLWDLSRWGPQGVDLFKENMINLMRLVSSCMPKKCIFLWLTALPTARNIKSSLLVDEIGFLKNSLQLMVMEANYYARQVVGAFGHDLLDLHHYCRMQLYYMKDDGIHYQPILMRYITNLILTHCCLAWNKPLPGNVHNRSLNKSVRLAFSPDHFEDYINVENILTKMEDSAPNRSPATSKNPSKRQACAQIDQASSKRRRRGSQRLARHRPYGQINYSRYVHR